MRIAVLAAVLASFPSLASAVITVRPSNQTPLPGYIVPLDIFADPSTLPFGQNERLNAFTMTVEAPEFGPPGGNRPWFVIPPPDPAGYYRFDLPDPIHAYVFGNAPRNSPYDPTGMSTYNIVYLAAALDPSDEGVDMDLTRNGFARLYVHWPLGLGFAGYTIRVGNEFLSLAGTAGTIEAVGGTGRIAIIPDPASLGIAAAAFLLLRRRRPA